MINTTYHLQPYRCVENFSKIQNRLHICILNAYTIHIGNQVIFYYANDICLIPFNEKSSRNLIWTTDDIPELQYFWCSKLEVDFIEFITYYLKV